MMKRGKAPLPRRKKLRAEGHPGSGPAHAGSLALRESGPGARTARAGNIAARVPPASSASDASRNADEASPQNEPDAPNAGCRTPGICAARKRLPPPGHPTRETLKAAQRAERQGCLSAARSRLPPEHCRRTLLRAGCSRRRAIRQALDDDTPGVRGGGSFRPRLPTTGKADKTARGIDVLQDRRPGAASSAAEEMRPSCRGESAPPPGTGPGGGASECRNQSSTTISLGSITSGRQVGANSFSDSTNRSAFCASTGKVR